LEKTMMTADQAQFETPRRKGFQDSIRILTEITSWQLWSSVVMMALLAGAIVLLLFPPRFAQAGLFRTLDPSLPVLGLLVLVCVVSGVTLRRQRRGLKLLREGLIEQMDSVIKQRAKAEQFYGMATQDGLTGLYNRRFGETRLQEEIARAEKSGEPLILIAADFDGFKQINDQYGHAAGDLALKEFSRRLQRAVRNCDVAIRVGGDEFLVIFPECALEKLPEIMSRMDSISFPFEGKKIPVSFSYGAAQYQLNDTPESMLRRADERLYAKKAKRKAAADAARTQEEAAKPDPSKARSIVAEAGFRRSERVPFEMPVQVYVSQENEQPALEETKTLSVNAHGALLALSTPVVMGQTLRLVNPRTQQEMECRVCRFGELHQGDTKEVGIEFATVAPTFWDVPSVPADWDPAWVPQQEGGCRQLSPFANAAPRVAPPKAAISYLSDDVGKALRSSSSPEWNPPWAARPEGEREQASMSNNAVPSAPLSAEALSVLCDDVERVTDGFRPLGQNPQWAPPAKSERPDVSANADAASPVSSLTDALSVIWGDTEAVKDVSRLVGLDPTWVPKPEDGLPKGQSQVEVPPTSPLADRARVLQSEGDKIIQEALQKLETPSEDPALAAKASQARTSKWLVVALALSVVLITVWFAMPRRFSGIAASTGAADRARSGQLNQEGAGMTSLQPSASTASGLSQSGLPTESTGFAADTCADMNTAPTNSSTVMSRVMPHAPGFRLATKEDFDPEAVSWLQNGGQEASGGIRGDFSSSGGSQAYLWVGEDKSWQVVVVTGTRMRCDLSFQSIAIAAPVSKEFIKRIQWDGPAPPEPSGDGLLIVHSAKDPASGVVLFLQGNDIVRSRPADYRQVPLGERK
jgi:diguanylate cyclase (GGDEF)-like protein